MSQQYDADAAFKAVAPLAALGWKIVKLWGVRSDRTCTCSNPDCRTPGKHPSGGADWQHRATDDEETIGRWCEDASTGENARINFGVRLGETSGIIDVEYDTDEAAAALRRFGLDMIDTPSYQSGRGVHRIFQHEDWMPDSGVVKVSGIEVRIGGGGKASQSVIPPSWHARGSRYEWLPGKSPEEVMPAKLPDAFRDAILAASRRHGSGVMAQAMQAVANGESFREGNRHAALVGIASHHASRIPQYNPKELAILINTLLDANCRCVPPKSEAEVVKIARDQFAYYQNKAAARKSQCTFAKAGLAWNAEDRCWDPGQWRLTVVNADPVEYKLRIPCPTSERTLTVVLTADNWYSSKGVAVAILKESKILDMHSPTGSRWASVWNGEEREDDQGQRIYREGLRERLMMDADHEHPGPEFSTVSANAAILISFFDQHDKREPETEDDRLPLASGLPRWLRGEDGKWRLWLKWNETLAAAWRRAGLVPISSMSSPGRRLIEQVTEVAGEKIRSTPCQRKGSDGKKRAGTWRVLTEAHVEAVRRIAGDVSAEEAESLLRSEPSHPS